MCALSNTLQYIIRTYLNKRLKILFETLLFSVLATLERKLHDSGAHNNVNVLVLILIQSVSSGVRMDNPLCDYPVVGYKQRAKESKRVERL